MPDEENEPEAEAKTSDPPNNTQTRTNLAGPEADAAPSDPPNNT